MAQRTDPTPVTLAEQVRRGAEELDKPSSSAPRSRSKCSRHVYIEHDACRYCGTPMTESPEADPKGG